ncbi:protein ovarian tumor locus-like isoform X2 [Thrips palmi]|nr:protein ovarian tumor locus-like isoform X2 [Thrips palmi]
MAPGRQYTNHPDPMDLWLETQGYYRKSTARDGSCLFRAMAEQIYYTQTFHLGVRKMCVEYMRNHLELFDGHHIEGGIENYLEHLQCSVQWGSHLEILAMSHLYKVDIVIFKEVGVPAEKVADTCYGKKVMLCFSHDRHYDSVYLKEFTKIAGFCQSLVYEMLYKNVFGMKDVDFAVDKMLHYKPLRHRGEPGSGGSRKFFSYSCNSIHLQRKGILVDALLDDGEVNVRELLMKGVTPFPYKVAKSLDPNIYRNVEFDVWIDYRRGLRLGFFGSNNELRVGVKCLVKIEENSHVAHVQEMAPDKGPVVVFVEALGEKCTVPFESLELLPIEPPTHKQVSSNQSNQRNAPNLGHMKSSESSGNNKLRKGRTESDKAKGTFANNAQLGLSSNGRRRNNSKSDQSSVTDISCDTLNRSCGMYQEANMMNSFPNFPVDGYTSTGGYHPYQILIPVSPRPDDVPTHWFPSSDAEGSTELSTSPAGGDFHYFTQPAEAASTSTMGEENADSSKDLSQSDLTDSNANYMLDLNSQEHQINFNAPKSILDDGADLPISDIQTLRFFYNLGNDVYRAQCGLYGWGGYTQPCPVTAPSTPNPTAMCAGKCVCGPVCITTVPTIHRLLEPTTPPTSSRRRRKDSASGVLAASEAESFSSGPNSQSSQATSTPLASVPPRFRGKGKNKKDAKAFEGQPLVHQPTLQIPSAEDPVKNETQNNGSVGELSSPAGLPVSFSPPYSYVYYPTSPVVPYSPVESDPYFTPLRLQFPTDYIPDAPQSPQCYSLNGDMSIYGSSPQFSMMATSPHYLVPASPGIYVGSPPAWGPMTPSTPQQQS